MYSQSFADWHWTENACVDEVVLICCTFSFEEMSDG